ncbi:hypothetical protein F8388_024857 [Cannabis sativa]|uniref:Uncharacterized protein n=1 Tax=Cannabis sativa TaxID=3483 RepID=A0A7J6H7E8_CANSA|nr:hypothetical protein F8388_024857 [Cannabis sativa]KAF4400401.1 hypothetical protein G4B88_018743 [Cannabis sativa]
MSANKLFEWLDSQEPKSVLYITFGSQNTIGATQMMELAIGQEKKWLPQGFEERAKEKNCGLLVRKWAPQLDILGHKSTGAFLNHCGWNSVMESLSQGVSIIGWPLAGEQNYNSKLRPTMGH